MRQLWQEVPAGSRLRRGQRHFTTFAFALMRCQNPGRGFQKVTLAPGAAATVTFPLGPADFAAATHAGAGAQAAAATWAIAVGTLTTPVRPPANLGTAPAPAAAADPELRAQSVGAP